MKNYRISPPPYGGIAGRMAKEMLSMIGKTMQSLKCKVAGKQCKVRENSAKFKMQSGGKTVQSSKCKVAGKQCKVKNAKCKMITEYDSVHFAL